MASRAGTSPPGIFAPEREAGTVRYAAGQMLTDYTYTGQRSEVEGFWLMYYNARWYDSALGRFAEGDTIVPEPGNPLAWDRFAYVYNNPLNLVDPSCFDPIYIEGWDDDYLQQQEGNTCAVVSVAVSLSILYENKITQQDIQFLYPSTYFGIGVIPNTQAEIINIDPEIKASYKRGTREDLLENLENGFPTIVSIAFPSIPYGHAMVVIGYDPDTDELIFFDPAQGDKFPENKIVEKYDFERDFSSFDEVWIAWNIFIPSNSMVTIKRIDTKVPKKGIYPTGGGGQRPGMHMFR